MQIRRGRQTPFLKLPLALIALLFSPALVSAGSPPRERRHRLVVLSEEHPLGEVDPDRALLYVLRPGRVGLWRNRYFLSGDRLLGINKSDSYFFAYLDPGKHLLWEISEGIDALELEVEAGDTYYVRERTYWYPLYGPTLGAEMELEVLDEQAGPATLAECKRFAMMTAAGREKGEKIARRYRDRARALVDARERREQKRRERRKRRDDAAAEPDALAPGRPASRGVERLPVRHDGRNALPSPALSAAAAPRRARRSTRRSRPRRARRHGRPAGTPAATAGPLRSSSGG